MKNEVNRALVAKKTKLFKSMNLIRRGSGASLNLFRYAAKSCDSQGVVTATSYGASDEHPMSIRSASDGVRRQNRIWKYAAMLLCLLTLGVGNAWGSTTYYSKVTTSQSPTGKGTVYVAAGSSFSGTATNKTQDVTNNSTHTYSLQATPTAAGYYFVNWTSTGTATLSFNNANSAATTCSISNCSSNSSSRTTGNAQANWAEITIGAGTASPASINATDNSTTCTDYTGTMTFATKADAKNDFKDATPPIVNTGHGAFEVTGWDVNASTGAVTVNYKFHGDGTFGGNVAKTSRSRSTSATLTLTSAVGTNKNTCSVSASFPNITIAAGEGTSFNATLNEEKQSTATFAVEYADDADDFTAEFSDETTGSTWGVDDISYADGVVTVTYTFNSTVADTHTATLTLTANDNAGGSSNTAELTAISKAKANDDASVTYNNTTTNYSTIAAAISAANSKPGAVVTLLRNIPSETTPSLSSPLNITGMMTLDLNSYTIARAGMADGSQQVITVNMSNAASVLTIKDSSVGHDGKISGTGGSNGNMLYAVCMEKGVLNFESGIVECTNTNSGDNAKATGIRVKNGCKLLMQGGTINATTSGNPARGIYATTTSSNAQMVVVSGGFINTKAANSSVGIDCESTDTPSSIDPDPTKANVILSGVTVDAQTTGTIEAIAVRSGAGVILGIQNGSYTATSKTTTAYAVQSSGHTAILGGTFNANATTNLAHAMRVEKGITAVKGGTFTATAEQKTAHGAYICDSAKLLTYGGTFKGVVNAMVDGGWVTGTQVYDGGTLEAQGGTFIGEANNLSQSSEIAVCAAGIYLNNSSKASYATISNATLQGKINNANLNGAANDSHRGAHGLMTRTTSPVTLTNCTISANSAHKYAFGVRSTNTPIDIKNSSISVTSSKSYNYGIYTYGTAAVTMSNSTVECTSQEAECSGAFLTNGTRLDAEKTNFNVTVNQSSATAVTAANSRGVNLEIGSVANLNGCVIKFKGNANYTSTVYGIRNIGTAIVEDCTIKVYSVKEAAYALCGGESSVSTGVGSGKFYVSTGTTDGSTVTTGTNTFSMYGNNSVGKTYLYGGYYTHINNLEKFLPAGYGIETLPSGSTEYGEGYRYAIRPTTAVGDPVCKIGAVGYTTLEEALEYASKNATSSNKLTIYMVANYTLPAGNYVLPQYTTLLVPYKSGSGAGATTAIGTTASRNTTKSAASARTAYKTLTFAAGAKMTVYGTIEASAQQYKTAQTICGDVAGAYGHIVLNEGANITLESGAVLISWGFVTGKGEIEAKNGAKAYEMVQTGWYKGGNTTSTIYGQTSYKVFVLTDYAYQNIECPITYHPGAQAIGSASTDYFSPDNVELVGTTNNSFFKMVPEEAYADTWVKKEYDPKTDYTTWTMNNGASLSALKLEDYSTANFYLPITSNFRIILNYGVMTISGDVEFLPGSELIVKKEAVGKIASGKYAFFYDNTDWCTGLGASGTGQYYYAPDYSPSWKAATGSTSNPRVVKYKQTASQTSKTDLPDASLYVQGVLDIEGYLYTTGDGNKASVGRNAKIYSSNEDAGKIIYKTTVPTASKTMYKATHAVGFGKGSFSDMIAGGNSTSYPAHLMNADGAYEQTASTTSGSSWIYKNDQWVMVTTEGCFSVEQISGVKHYYAYPAGFVEVTSKDADATTHLYTDAETGNRRFLAESDCTWWEVEPEPYDGNKYKCVTPDHNGRYKYYEYVGGAWQEATVTVTWNINGATTDYTVLYGTHPKYLSAAPSKSAIASEYYTWLGWTVGSAEGEFYDKDAELPAVTENTTFYAYFEAHKYEYTVTFRSHDGAVLEAKRWAHGEIPTYDGTPTKTPTAAKEYIFDGWSSTKGGSKVTVAAASAAAEYFAHFAESDRKYTIQWVNYNGTVLKEEQVTYNTTPSAPATPTRPNDNYYTYTFDAWSPAISAVDGDQTYTATYNYEKQVPKYTATFKNGSKTVYAPSLKSGEVPVFDGTIPTKTADAQYTYTFDGWSTTDGGALAYASGDALPALTADVTYYAHFATTTNNYRIIWKSENGKVTLETDPTVPYGTTPSFDGAKPTKDRMGATVYTFDGWSAAIGGAKIALPQVTGNATYYAHFSDDPVYTVTFNANGHGTAPEAQEVVRGQKVTEPVAPSETGYTFGGWYKESACTNVWNFASDVVTANTTLYAKWTPNTNTAYAVEHYWQNINDGNYTKHETVNMTGTTDAPTAAVAKNYSGFEAALPFVQGTIVPDGSTVVKIYYNRKTYTIIWDVKLNGEQEAYKEETLRYGATPSYGSTPTKEQSDREVYTFSGWTPTPYAVDKAQTYSGSFNVTPRPYTITFVNDNGVVLQSSDFGWGSTPSYDYELNGTPVSSHTGDGYTYTFTGWKPELAPVSKPATYTAVYSRSAESITVNTPETVTNNTTADSTTVKNGGTLTVGTGNEDITLQSTTIIVESGGQLDVAEGGSIEADVFIIQATTEDQGEDDAKEEVQVSGELSETGSKNVQTVYYDLTRQHGARKFLARVWYAVAVPWAVEVPTYADGGVYIKQGDNYVQQRLGATFDLITYDGYCRATQGASADCWVYLEDEIAGGADAVMVPGKLYMIYLTEETSTIRFKKKASVKIHTDTLNVSPYTADNCDDADANWNGIANPATYRAYMNVEYEGLVQKFVPGTQPRDRGSYLPINLNAKQSVGQPLFVQVNPNAASTTIQVTRTKDNPSASAPRRMAANGEQEVRYAISIAANGKLADRLYIQTAEEKENGYEQGKDMSKMGVSAYVAQMWVDRYDSKLCLNTAEWDQNTADYPLGIFAPQAGEYKIFAPADIETNDNIYLTLDGRVIWNLSYAPYYASLEQGTTNRYGLRLVRNAPQVATDIDEAVVDAHGEIRKVLVDDKVYIIRGEKVYSIDGRMVK